MLLYIRDINEYGDDFFIDDEHDDDRISLV